MIGYEIQILLSHSVCFILFCNFFLQGFGSGYALDLHLWSPWIWIRNFDLDPKPFFLFFHIKINTF